ncbi:hypothetical protein MKZ38_004259 [Zalerion maritima]|uniref:Uncharacterized protein n=1 Tax=Zalerion maritima TaxID=339359 RepID=A0AAD5WXF6_9PEZI|nr:hypothetical protein MKZ38_004259 [Zalerion maritima]
MENYANALAAVVATPTPVLPDLHDLVARDANDCLDAGDILSSCVSAMPTFTDASTEEIAQCFCCDGSSWDAEHFDDPVGSCYDYLTDELPAETSMASIYYILDGFCGSVGSVNCGGATTTAAPTATAAAGSGSAGCASAGDMIGVCSSIMPDFSGATDEELAACLCYDNSGDWDPSEFDDNMSGCLNWASASDTELFSSVSALSDYCTDIGPVTVAADESPSTTLDPGSATTDDSGSGGGLGLGGGFGSSSDSSSDSTTTQVITDPTDSPAENVGERMVAGGGVAGLVAWVLGFYIL